ncbi:MAG: V-type ATP synthase subunit F [Synergistetes bacterium]|nr:V-type ATP synthase subunit F [Synergistota bacterium]MDW8191737.1 V-type ATP synthase subunit F [Synergistota bacterium]
MKGKIFVLGNKEAVTGFQLAGISGETPEDKESAIKAFHNVFSSGKYALLIITEEIASMIREEIEEVKSKELYPIIVEIPGKGGWKEKHHDYLERAIREALGLGLKG